MANLSLKDKGSFLISWTLVLMCSAAKQDYYFHDWRNLTWEGARTRCQVCFKELVTLTPENIQTISQNLSSDCWIGLRKNFASTSNSSMPWSRWADGEPLIFQNWYPGWPVSKSSFPKVYYCSPRSDTTLNSSHVTTVPTMAAGCMQFQYVPEADGNYTEDSCVAMLSFGAWVEKECSELLPFICYEDRFFGKVIVAEKTSESANLTWQPGPGNISHYRVEVKSDGNLSQYSTGKLTRNLGNLTAGTRYSVQVFPVKCNRDLNPQEVVFYTIPNKVENLTVNVTETSVFLSWTRPAANVDFYLIEVQDGKRIKTKQEHTEVGSLIPGSLYTFTVLSGVGNDSVRSDESNITAYTKPGKVSNLRVTHNNISLLQLNWVAPEGKNTGFLVKAVNETNATFFDKEVSETEVNIKEPPLGTKVIFSVTALTDDGNLQGEKVTIINYTVPGPISDLTLDSKFDSLTAKWKSSAGSSSSFTVELQQEGKNIDTVHNLTEPLKHFDKLKSGAKFTVIVYAVSGHLKGPPLERSKSTSVSSPGNVTVISSRKTQITYQWTAPENMTEARYSVRINSSFWGQSWSDTVESKTSYTFGGLTPGTRYDFEVRVVVDKESSAPVAVSHCTVAEEREITLSMLCSSSLSLHCDNSITREDVFNQLHKHFNKLLGDNIFWKLEKQETEN